MTKKQSNAVATTKEGKPLAPSTNNIRATNPTTLQFKSLNGETDGKAHSRMMASPSVNAAVTMFRFHPMKEGVNLTDLVDEIGKQALTIREGCMDRPEAMLAAQAHALDAIFTALAEKAAMNMQAGYLQATDTYMRMALKAQSQCRTTVEAIAEIKYPKSATFIKQANIANQQQVNNGAAGNATNTPAHAHEKNITPTNELLSMEAANAPLDQGRTGAAGGTNPALAAVEAVHRSKDQTGKGSGRHECS